MALRRRPGGRSRRARAALLLLVSAACASEASWSGGRFTHPKLGGSLADLAALEPGWKRAALDGAALTYRHADGSRASWVRDCRSVDAPARALARALWIGLTGSTIENERGLEIAGAPGWRLEGLAREGEHDVRVASLTRVSPRCEDYWILVEPFAELHHQDAFARWWQSFSDAGGAQ